MAVEQQRYAPSGYAIACTMPDELLRHNISDEELDMLCDPKRDELWETKWAVFGIFLGVLPSAIEAIMGYAKSTDGQIGFLALIQIVLVFGSLAVWIVLRFVVKRKRDSSHEKRDEIRARTKRIQEGTLGEQALS